jgi:hypothetical protein
MEKIDQHMKELAAFTGRSGESVKNSIFNDTSAHIASLRLSEVKKYLSYFKFKLGLSDISLKMNKSESSKQLHAVLLRFKNGDNLAEERQVQQPRPPVQHHNHHHQQQPLANGVPQPQPSKAHPMNNLSAAELKVINTPRKFAVYGTLKAAGLSPQTALKGIAEATPQEINDEEELLMENSDETI